MELHDAGRDPGNADHWRALGLDFDEALEVLNARLNEAFAPPSTLSRMGIPSRPLPSHPAGELLVGGTYHDRTAVVMRADAEELMVVGFYPFLEQGGQVRARLMRVAEFDHGLMARVEVNVELSEDVAIPVTFFDPMYARDWPHYLALDDAPLSLLLSGLAYTIEVVEPATLPLDLGPLREALAKAGVTDLDALPDASTVSTQGMSVFLPADGGNADDWGFQGRLVAIEEHVVCGREAWQAKVRVAGSDGAELWLPVLFTRAALRGRLPEVGEDVGGVLWLQGWLWGPA